ncbi:hypothetical protein KFL_002180050 [Klebsormidium nitens]|uniref:O-fucosyltransferase family protein n=1 Tax=Klebsormidium nitens TaxID=105231 RepID=A0A1Y1I275_KLENI|nr:hypothetical protein KFL_002180050 [Klebsormidium nitens]|eukprot:GAQ85030.1 hypothetical protein KFL_002180050 [Klebsormidium nitens]
MGDAGSSTVIETMASWVGNEKVRGRLQRRFFRSFLPSYQVLGLAAIVLFVINVQLRSEKVSLQGGFEQSTAQSLQNREREALTAVRSSRHLSSSMHSKELLAGALDSVEKSAPEWSIPARTLPPVPTRNVQHAIESRTLRFLTCNGFANQRLALVYGIVIAKLTDRIPVLPDFLLNGLQRSDAWIVDTISNGSVPMSEVYNVQEFRNGLASRLGMQVLTPAEAPPLSEYVKVSFEGVTDTVASTERKHDLHVAIECAFLRLSRDVIKENEELFWAVLESLQPAKQYEEIVSHAVATLAEGGRNGAEPVGDGDGAGFSFLHMRAENDWLAHCRRWESIPDGRIRNNCLTNTWTVHEALLAKRVSPSRPLYVASMWSDIDPTNRDLIFSNLEKAGFKVYTQEDILPEMAVPLSREQSALVDFYIALASEKFMGNSVSSFSALLIYERTRAEKWASWYNGGNIPLDDFIPVLRLPWVFTYNGWSQKYDYMLKAAVRSAARFGTLAPYCLFSGNRTAEIHQWLVAQNVRIIYHNPSWATQIARLLGKENLRTSHLYANPEMAVGTWQRIDIPIVPELEQFEYVLFTDSDVYFRRALRLSDFGLPLPPAIGMASEAKDVFPYNAGIMLMNLPRLRVTYDRFLSFVLGNKNGLFFSNYGPQDQGAYNQFYETEVKHTKLPQTFNAKPYHEHRDTAFIVHFHGPKPHDFSEFFKTGDCIFRYRDDTEVVNTLCELGIKRAYCTYIREWLPLYESGDSVDSGFSPGCSLEVKVLTQVARRIAW